MKLVTKSAIDFTASAVLSDGEIVDDFCLSKHIKNKYAILFSIHMILLLFAQLN
jgi:peroxiredoxin (alkyl hydroperoxide reductase subunit C)